MASHFDDFDDQQQQQQTRRPEINAGRNSNRGESNDQRDRDEDQERVGGRGSFGGRSQQQRTNNRNTGFGRTKNTESFSSVFAAFGLSSTASNSPELLAASTGLEASIERLSKREDNACYLFTQTLVNGATEKLPGNRSILLFGVTEIDSGVTAFIGINPRSALTNVRKQMRQHATDDFIGHLAKSSSRTFARPDTLTEQIFYNTVTVEDTRVQLTDRLAEIFTRSVMQKHQLSNVSSSFYSSITVSVVLPSGNNTAVGIHEDHVNFMVDALRGAVVSELMAASNPQINLSQLSDREKNFTVSITNSMQDHYDQSSEIAVASNMQMHVQVGSQSYRNGGNEDGGGNIYTLGTQHAFAEYIINPNFDQNQKPHRRDNPLFLPVLTLTATECNHVFSGMADLLRGICAKAITPEEVIAAAAPINAQREYRALRNIAAIGLIPEFGTNGQMVPDELIPELTRAIINVSAEEVRVRVMYDPAVMADAISMRDVFLAVYGAYPEDHEQTIYSNLENIFDCSIKDRPQIGWMSGVWYSGYFDGAGGKYALNSIDLISALTAMQLENDRVFSAMTNGMLMFGETSHRESLSEHYELIRRVQPAATYSSIAFGIEINPEYLNTLIMCTEACNFKVHVHSTLRRDAVGRQYDITRGGFNPRKASRGGNSRRF